MTELNATTIQLLREMAESSFPTYSDFARGVLADPQSVPAAEIAAVIDGYLNDPYLSR